MTALARAAPPAASIADRVAAIDEARLAVELDAQEIVDGRPILGARHPLHRHVSSGSS